MYDLQLKNLRKDRGLNQTELGEALNVTQRTISNWEVGRCELPLSVACEVADFFGCTVDELAGLKSKPCKVSKLPLMDSYLSGLNANGVWLVEEYARVLSASGLYSRDERAEGLA